MIPSPQTANWATYSLTSELSTLRGAEDLADLVDARVRVHPHLVHVGTGATEYGIKTVYKSDLEYDNATHEMEAIHDDVVPGVILSMAADVVAFGEEVIAPTVVELAELPGETADALAESRPTINLLAIAAIVLGLAYILRKVA